MKELDEITKRKNKVKVELCKLCLAIVCWCMLPEKCCKLVNLRYVAVPLKNKKKCSMKVLINQWGWASG